jgi:hypothetical protein
MMRRYAPRFAATLSLFLLGPIAIPDAQFWFDSTDDVIFYPTYGVQDAGTRVWNIHMRAKVQESRDPGRHFRKWFSDLESRGTEEDNRFAQRLADLVAEDKPGKKLKFRFDGDASKKEYRIEDGSGGFPETSEDGIVDGVLRLSDSDAQRMLEAQGSANGWLAYQATSRGQAGAGRLRLIGPTGQSVISDIDDTIKITEVPSGKLTVLLNTFYRPFAVAPEMIEKYRGFGDAAFHYVSGGPWQLYRPVSSFLIDKGPFPAGSFHMKHLSGNITSPIKTLESLEKFAATEGTFNHKVAQIKIIMGDFPGRTFILIGDSGECDPEVYREVKGTALGQRIQDIIIRDVVNAREKARHRVQDMTILTPPAVIDGGTQPTCGAQSSTR